MFLPTDIKLLILDYYYDLVHTEKLDRVHAEMILKCHIIFRPRRIMSYYYFISWD
jgi:hypothetical protein